MIEINELTKYYGDRKAVGPLSFCIDKGEVVGLLGLNGAGKTTTLRMLSSELLPTSGGMMVDGIDLVEQPERVRPRIGYLPDRPPLYGEMSVREYLVFAGRLRGLPRAALTARVGEVIEATDLHAYADDRIDTLSHGYRQRVGIGQAIIHRPTLLLLDEPISGLDPVQIVEMRALIRSLRGEHTTVVSSHILSEISETCDRLLVIRDGEIVASGTEEELAVQMTVIDAVDLTVRAPATAQGGASLEALTALLEPLDGVAEVNELGSIGRDPDVVCVEVGLDADVREQICRTLVEADFGILGLERSSRELEDVFLRLTKGSRADREATA